MVFCDFHFHLVPSVERCGMNDVQNYFSSRGPGGQTHCGITCAHSPEEFVRQEELIKAWNNENILNCFGIHPQMPLLENAYYLESLLAQDRIYMVGETGFDYFTKDLILKKSDQKKAFEICLELALKFNRPLVVHDRKALDEIFRYSAELKKLPFVLFHSFAFSDVEAFSLVRKGINAYFSFGKQILNGNKKSISCVKNLNDRILFETDAPFQFLKNEEFTCPWDVARIYEFAAALTGIPLDELCFRIFNKFTELKNISRNCNF